MGKKPLKGMGNYGKGFQSSCQIFLPVKLELPVTCPQKFLTRNRDCKHLCHRQLSTLNLVIVVVSLMFFDLDVPVSPQNAKDPQIDTIEAQVNILIHCQNHLLNNLK